MTESTTQIVKKIKNLLSLADSHVNLNEAIAAAGKAQELMVKFNLTMEMVTEITGKRESEIVDCFRDQRRFLNLQPLQDWHALLASGLCDVSHCRCYISTVDSAMVSYESTSEQERVLCVVGYEDDVDFVFTLFPWFVSEIDRLIVLNGISQTADWKNSFRFGANKKLIQRFNESRKSAEGEMMILLEGRGHGESAKHAIIALDNRINKIDEQMKDIDLKPRVTKNVGPEGLSAFRIGYDKGDEIDLLNEKKIEKDSRITLLGK